MLYFAFVVVVALAMQGTYADLVHGMLYIFIYNKCDKIKINTALLRYVPSSDNNHIYIYTILVIKMEMM